MEAVLKVALKVKQEAFGNSMQLKLV